MPVLRSVEPSRGRGSGVNDRPRVILLTIKIATPAASNAKPTIRSQGSPPLGQRGPTTAQATAAAMTIDCRTTQPSPRCPSAGGLTVERRTILIVNDAGARLKCPRGAPRRADAGLWTNEEEPLLLSEVRRPLEAVRVREAQIGTKGSAHRVDEAVGSPRVEAVLPPQAEHLHPAGRSVDARFDAADKAVAEEDR